MCECVCVTREWPDMEITKSFQSGINQVTEMEECKMLVEIEEPHSARKGEKTRNVGDHNQVIPYTIHRW